MEPIFNLPYSEYRVILLLSRFLKKKAGYGFYIPLSRQQKGVDFLVYNHNANKKISFQIKSSRAYEKPIPKRELKAHRYQFYLWFNNFFKSYARGMADFYILHGLYPKYSPVLAPTNSKAIIWQDLILVYSDKEMQSFLSTIRNKRNVKPSKFFGFGFDDPESIYLTRGAAKDISVSEHLLAYQIHRILK